MLNSKKSGIIEVETRKDDLDETKSDVHAAREEE